jgi:hypothetical protein
MVTLSAARCLMRYADVRTRDRWCEIGDSKVRQCDEHDVRKVRSRRVTLGRCWLTSSHRVSRRRTLCADELFGVVNYTDPLAAFLSETPAVRSQ